MLDTIQKHNKLNKVERIDKIGPGGAYHEYKITTLETDKEVGTIVFQKGPRKEENSISGVTNEDLLEIVRDRLKCFQAGEFACDYNNNALVLVEAALKAMNERVEDRVKRNVLGKNVK